MQLTHIAAFIAGCGLAVATGYDVCLNDCSLAGIPMPDQHTFQLPLENFWSEQCLPTIVGTYKAPLATSRTCLTFAGTALHFNFEAFPGYNIKSAVVTWKVKGNIANSGSWSSPPPTTNILCTPSTGGSFVCDLAFSDILKVSPTTSIPELMGGMCPNGDREALGFYFQLSGLVEPVGGGPAVPFVQQYPCATRASDRSCTAWKTCHPYIEVAYRCSKCNNAEVCPPASTSTSSSVASSTTLSSTTSSSAEPSTTSTSSSVEASTTSTSTTSTSSSAEPSTTSTSTTSSAEPSTTSTTSLAEPSTTSTSTTSTTSSAPPTLKTCSLGTAFGYQDPVSGVQKSFTLDTQSGQGCNRWGWYSTPTLSELQSGLSGPLYVGAGGNDITKAVEVGIWVATANAVGGVTVTYLLNPPYALAEVHVHLACLPLEKCAPGGYTYGVDGIPNVPTWSNPVPLAYPTCTGGNKAVLVIHAAVNELAVVGSCPPPKAS